MINNIESVFIFIGYMNVFLRDSNALIYIVLSIFADLNLEIAILKLQANADVTTVSRFFALPRLQKSSVAAVFRFFKGIAV